MEILKKLKESPKLKIRSDFGIKTIHTIRENVAQSAIVFNDNGIAKIDFTLKQLFLDLNIISCVLGFDISELKSPDGSFDTDKLCELSDFIHFETDIFKTIIKELKSRGVYIQEKIDDQIKEELRYTNSIENLICEKVNLIISKIPDLQNIIKDLPNIMQKLDLDKIKDAVGLVEKVSDIKNLKTASEVVDLKNGKN